MKRCWASLFRDGRAALMWVFLAAALALNPTSLSAASREMSVCLAVMERAARLCGAPPELARPVCQAVLDYRRAAALSLPVRELAALTAAIIRRESCFDPRATSRAFAVGLMQVHYPYWKTRFPELTLADLYDPYFNVGFGLWVLDYEWRRTGSLSRALALYGGFRRRNPHAYVRAILAEARDLVRSEKPVQGGL